VERGKIEVDCVVEFAHREMSGLVVLYLFVLIPLIALSLLLILSLLTGGG
jgi:hypothetical protein